jgi:hypothetical protein
MLEVPEQFVDVLSRWWDEEGLEALPWSPARKASYGYQ